MDRLSSNFLQNYAPSQSVEIPIYDRTALKAGILHIGPGNFPLAHIVAITHELMQSGDKEALNYGVVVVSTQTRDRTDNLAPQDNLYTIAEQGTSGQNKMTIVGSVVKTMFVPDNANAVIAQFASTETRIVSLTITPQAHQSYVKADGSLHSQHPDIAHDLNSQNEPKTFLGLIVRGIQKREELGLPGVTVMNLDNMEHNGVVLNNAIRQFALAYDEKLAAAIQSKYTFPNSMVDRIVPKTTPKLLDQVSAQTGFIDRSSVPAEPMPSISWVTEENFANGRPAWEKVNIRIVPDVLPYEKMKLRILNVSHSFMANLGDLADMPYIDLTMSDPTIKAGTLVLMDNETGPTVPHIPSVNLGAYKREILERFANPEVQDTTWRVAKDAPLQVVLDSARDQLKAGGSYELLALNTAAWMRRFRVETNELGGKIDAVHPMVDALKAKAKEGGNDPAAMFTLTEVFGDIGQQKEFVQAVATYMEMLEVVGVKATIEAAIANSGAALQRSAGPQSRADGRFTPTPEPR